MNNSSIHKTLIEFGLSENEIVVYLHCLKVTDATPYTISKATSIPRTTVYDVLLGLSLKGLVTLFQSDGLTKQQTRVRAKNPFVIREILAKKRKKLFEIEADVMQFLPYLKREYLVNITSPYFKFFDGVDGFKKVYLDDYKIIGKYEISVFENLMPTDVLTAQEIDDDIDRCSKSYESNRFPVNELVVWNDWSKHVLSYQLTRSEDYFKHRTFRYIEDIGLSFKSRILIAGNFVRISTANEDEYWGVIIQSKSLKDSMYAVFKYVWNGAKEVTPSMVKKLGVNQVKVAQLRNG